MKNVIIHLLAFVLTFLCMIYNEKMAHKRNSKILDESGFLNRMIAVFFGLLIFIVFKAWLDFLM